MPEGLSSAELTRLDELVINNPDFGMTPLAWLRNFEEAPTAANINGLLERLRGLLKSPGLVLEEEEVHWDKLAEFSWVPSEAALCKVPATLAVIEAIDPRLEELGAGRRYGCGGNVAWIAWPAGEPLSSLERILSEAGTRGLILWAPGISLASPVLNRASGAFEDRIRSVLDSPGTFSSGELERGR